MKKYISVLLVLLSLFLCGCSRIPDAHGGPSQTDAPQNGQSASYNDPYITDYDEYLEHIKTIDWPYGFAEWDDLDFLGEMTDFFNKVHSYPFYTEYYYGFDDGSGATCSINVDHTIDKDEIHELYESAPLMEISDDMTSMRRLADEEQNNSYKVYKVVRNGVQYIYGGLTKLNCIIWIQNGVEYTIAVEKFYDYPEDVKDTFIARLLSVDDAEFKLALAEINPDPMTN